MPLYAYDNATPLSAEIYKKYGGVAVNCYTSGNYAIDANYVKNVRAGGVAPFPNYERGLWEFLESINDKAAGIAAANVSIPNAIKCGFPSNGTIWYPHSVDVSVPSDRFWEVDNAFQGIQQVNAGRFLISIYGEGALISYLRGKRTISEKGWLSASSAFPGYQPLSPDVCLYQQIGNFIPGASTDRNVITDPKALKAWWPDGSPYKTGETDMTPEEHEWLRRLDIAFNNGSPTPFKERAELTNLIRGIAAVPTLAELRTELAKVAPDVTLSDAQLGAVSALLVAHMPSYTGTFTPTV